MKIAELVILSFTLEPRDPSERGSLFTCQKETVQFTFVSNYAF